MIKENSQLCHQPLQEPCDSFVRKLGEIPRTVELLDGLEQENYENRGETEMFKI